MSIDKSREARYREQATLFPHGWEACRVHTTSFWWCGPGVIHSATRVVRFRTDDGVIQNGPVLAREVHGCAWADLSNALFWRLLKEIKMHRMLNGTRMTRAMAEADLTLRGWRPVDYGTGGAVNGRDVYYTFRNRATKGVKTARMSESNTPREPFDMWLWSDEIFYALYDAILEHSHEA